MSDPATVAPLGSDCTPAELRVIDVMRTARSEREAAIRLGLSVHTVHAHLRNARSRFGAKTTRELLVAAVSSHVHAVAARS